MKKREDEMSMDSEEEDSVKKKSKMGNSDVCVQGGSVRLSC